MSTSSTIIYTLTDEAPLSGHQRFFADHSHLCAPAGVTVETSDISVAARVLADIS